jgi:predicted Zn-ribbon and HTH transcriptional regulator
MSQTIRQVLITLLQEGPASAKDLSAQAGVSEKDVLAHLDHIRRSLRRGCQRLVVEPAWCRSCGFEFSKRDRVAKPGHCPVCRGTFIEAPSFLIRDTSAEEP